MAVVTGFQLLSSQDFLKLLNVFGEDLRSHGGVFNACGRFGRSFASGQETEPCFASSPDKLHGLVVLKHEMTLSQFSFFKLSQAIGNVLLKFNHQDGFTRLSIQLE